MYRMSFENITNWVSLEYRMSGVSRMSGRNIDTRERGAGGLMCLRASSMWVVDGGVNLTPCGPASDSEAAAAREATVKPRPRPPLPLRGTLPYQSAPMKLLRLLCGLP